MEKYLQVMNAVLNSRPTNDLTIETKELFKIQQLFLDFNNLVSYENNQALTNEEIVTDAVVDNLFYHDSYYKGTFEYSDLLNHNRVLNKIQPGQTISERDVSVKNFSSVEIKRVYEKLEDKINLYYQLMPIYNVEAKEIPKTYLSYIQQLDNVEEANGNYFIYDKNLDDNISCFEEDNKLYLVGYDIRRNPFKNSHLRIFDRNGEIEDLSKLNIVDIVKQIRHAEAHHSIYTYYNGRIYGAKVAPLDKNRVALFSNRWHEYMIKLAVSQLNGKRKTFEAMCVPHTTKSVRNDTECIDKINSIMHVTVQTDKEYEISYVEGVMFHIISNYEILTNPTMSLKEYLNTHLPKYLPEFKLKVKPLENADWIKNRLVGDQNFYNICPKEKDNAFEQESFIKRLIGIIYDDVIVKNEMYSESGKVRPVKVDLQELALLLNAEITRFQKLAGVVKTQGNTSPYALFEKHLVFPMLCAYKNLIRNHFVDDTHEIGKNVPKGFQLSGKAGEQNYELKLLDMKMFEIYNPNNKKEHYFPQTVNQKISVLRAVRNAICHNNLYIQFSRNCDLNDSKYVFDLSEGYSGKVRVNIKQFTEFINQPIFANYQSNTSYEIDAKNVDELKQFINKLCKPSESVKNKTQEMGEE